MKVIILVAAIGILFISCNNRHYSSVEVKNPAFKPNTVFHSYEDLTSPKFVHLIKKYQLDTIFHGETNEFKRILLLRHWIMSVIRTVNLANVTGPEHKILFKSNQ
jgi:hypothetical protein